MREARIFYFINKNPNLSGIVALIMWSFGALWVVEIQAVPTFEALTCSLGISFALTAVWLTYSGRWRLVLKQPFYIWIPGLIGIFFNDIAYFTAFKYAPAAQVDIINYLWPVFIVLLSSFLPQNGKNNHLSLKHIVAILLAFFGTAVAIYDALSSQPFQAYHLIGYGCALIAALSWSFYMVCSLHPKYKAPPEMIGMFCGLGALLAFFTHGFTEQTILLNWHQILPIVMIGLTSSGAAYYFWQHGMKAGNAQLLSVLSYWVPIFSLLVLFWTGRIEYTHSIAFAGMCVTGATIMVNPSKTQTNK